MSKKKCLIDCPQCRGEGCDYCLWMGVVMADKEVAQVALEMGLRPIDLESGKPIEKDITPSEALKELLAELEKVQPFKWLIGKLNSLITK